MASHVGCRKRYWLEASRHYSVQASNLFSLLEVFFANGSLPEAREAALLSRRMCFWKLGPALMPVVLGCPPLFTLVHLVPAIALDLEGEAYQPIVARGHLRRALILARYTQDAGSSRQDADGAGWAAHFKRAWPALEEAPSRIWRKAGCRLPRPLTVTGLLTTPLAYEDLGCPEGDEIFLHRHFFLEAGPGSPKDLARAMHGALLSRPLPPTRQSHLSFLKAVLEQHLPATSNLAGLCLEFGTGSDCHSAGIIADHLDSVFCRDGVCQSAPRLHTFDSFQGLSRDWGSVLPAGSFATNGTWQGNCLKVKERVEMVEGWYSDTLRPFLRGVVAGSWAHHGAGRPALAFVHLDADLYESTLLVLTELLPHLAPGTVLVFDDVWEIDFSEVWRALHEFLQLDGWHWGVEVLAAPFYLPQPAGGFWAHRAEGGQDSLALRLLGRGRAESG